MYMFVRVSAQIIARKWIISSIRRLCKRAINIYLTHILFSYFLILSNWQTKYFNSHIKNDLVIFNNFDKKFFWPIGEGNIYRPPGIFCARPCLKISYSCWKSAKYAAGWYIYNIIIIIYNNKLMIFLCYVRYLLYRVSMVNRCSVVVVLISNESRSVAFIIIISAPQ